MLRALRRRGRPAPEVLAAVAVALLLLAPVWAVRGLIVVGKPKARVGLKPYALDLVYGAAPAPPARQIPLVFPVATPPVDLGPFTFPPPMLPSADLCPTAGPDVFPKEPAAFDIAGRVRPGRYLWKQDGTFELATFKFPLKGLTFRAISNLQAGASGSFTYDVTSIGLTGRRIESIEVLPGQEIRLTDLVLVAPNGARREFHPLLPVTLLPLPVTIGEAVTGVGVDPINRLVMVVQATVKGRLRVDACGEMVDSWLVQGTREFRDLDQPAGTPGAYELAVAPQMGGLFVFDHLVESGSFPTTPPLPYSLDMKSWIGTLEPAK